jgi:dihydrofolate reductase
MCLSNATLRRYVAGVEKVFVIGGAQVYAEAMVGLYKLNPVEP